MRLSKPKLVDNPKQHLRTYSFLSLLANILIALSYGVSLAFGMGLVSLSPVYIIIAMGVVASLGTVGKFIKQLPTDNLEENSGG